ncbi:MAG: SulP family inorganic anion transporter [Hyphomicrobiales bacterium]|nr:SulP family inorganic anion transporter [Hyphomicrobiales bacterium]
MKIFNELSLGNLRGDLFGGVTAAIVALPLALAFGVASGAGPIAGLWGAIAVGFFAALFGGTPSQISGPTGPMTVVMTAVVMKYAHDPAMAFTVVIMGGALQVLFGVLRLGRFVSLVPFTVISGFMSGIGCIIILLQVAPLLGQPGPGGGTIGALRALPDLVAGVHWDALAVGALSLAIVTLCPASISRRLPSPLIALVAGTALVWTVLPGAPVLGDIPQGLPQVHLPTLGWEALPDMLGSALVLALLGAIDSLLTSLIADNVTGTSHDSDQELIGQGIGNLVAGLIGGIPGAGATMRTVVNVRAGGRTAVSGIVHAVVLVAVVLGLGGLAGHIPHAVLAGILFKVGYDIIDWPFLRVALRAPREGVVVMLLVLVLTVFVDLIIAVGVGVAAASLLMVHRMSVLQLETIRAGDGGFGEMPLSDDEHARLQALAGRVLYVHFGGPVTFAAAKGLTKRLVVGSHHTVIILDMTGVTFVDTSAAFAVGEVVAKAQERGVRVLVAGLRAPVAQVLDRLGILKPVAAEDRFARHDEAIAAAEALGGGAGDAA